MPTWVRPARHEDLASISEWTRDTFDWGDYVPDRFASWVESARSVVLVHVDREDAPIAMVHATMLSNREGWLEGARVRPDHQRRGLGTVLNDAGVEWAREQGANVVRLAIETDNQAARNQVERLGYREGSTWVSGFLQPETGYRSETAHRLRPAAGADVDAAWMFWSTTDMAVAGRQLLNEGWQWRKARIEDLRDAITHQTFFQSRAGWVVFREGIDLETMWVAAAPEDFPALLEGVVDLATTRRVEDLVVKLPSLDWVEESLRRAGFRTSGIAVHYKPV